MIKKVPMSIEMLTNLWMAWQEVIKKLHRWLRTRMRNDQAIFSHTYFEDNSC